MMTPDAKHFWVSVFLKPYISNLNVVSVAVTLFHSSLTMSSSPQAPLARPVLHCVLVSMLHGLFYGYNTGVIGGLSTAVVQQQFGGWQVVNGSETADGAWNCTLAHATPAQIEAGKTTVTSLEGLFTADILFGNFVGALLGPWSANRWGRKVGVAIGAVFATVCPILMALFPSYAAQVCASTRGGGDLAGGSIAAVVRRKGRTMIRTKSWSWAMYIANSALPNPRRPLTAPLRLGLSNRPARSVTAARCLLLTSTLRPRSSFARSWASRLARLARWGRST